MKCWRIGLSGRRARERFRTSIRSLKMIFNSGVRRHSHSKRRKESRLLESFRCKSSIAKKTKTRSWGKSDTFRGKWEKSSFLWSKLKGQLNNQGRNKNKLLRESKSSLMNNDYPAGFSQGNCSSLRSKESQSRSSKWTNLTRLHSLRWTIWRHSKSIRRQPSKHSIWRTSRSLTMQMICLEGS